jgi:epoxyqueuosine reductase
MSLHSNTDLTAQILGKAKSLGASLAGIANIPALQNSPSYKSNWKIDLPTGGNSVLVLALVHEDKEPELDWWDGKRGTQGNRRLVKLAEDLIDWSKEELNISALHLPYHAENGGIFLKDSAVLAGLGTIGKNNLLVTPEFGPCIRLRALLLDADFVFTGPKDFAPCKTCDTPCRRSCPQKAFKTGSYSRTACNIQMKKDEINKTIFEKTDEQKSSGVYIKYCRACELACPVGVNQESIYPIVA